VSRLRRSQVAEGDELPGLQVWITRADLVRYAGASGDFNPIHWSDRTAAEAGLPGVIAHGMLTMALANRLVTTWAGDPGAVVQCAVRFTRPVVVPDDADGALVEFSGTVAQRHDDGTVVVAITACAAGQTVLGKATATVVLA
jgi:acyl dehydratase